jgi:hypothetical protein
MHLLFKKQNVNLNQKSEVHSMWYKYILIVGVEMSFPNIDQRNMQ